MRYMIRVNGRKVFETGDPASALRRLERTTGGRLLSIPENR